MSECGVLCRYFFQQMLLEENDTHLEELASSMMLSSRPTLAELRRKFPFEGSYHFRLQVALSDALGSYCWRDLTDENQAFPITGNGEVCVKVLQLTYDKDGDKTTVFQKDVVDVVEDRQFLAFFNWQSKSNSDGNFIPHPQQMPQHDVGSVLFGVKKALTSKMKGSAMAQTLQKHSAQMWEKVTAAAAGVGVGSSDSPPTATALAQLAKVIGALKAPLHTGNHEHVDLLRRLWTSCFETQPFVITGPEWKRLKFHSGEPMREMRCLLPLQCLVRFHEAHRTVALSILNDQSGPEGFEYAQVGSQIAYMLADILHLKDGSCLGLERPFWRLFEDPMAFYELYCISFRAFDASWKRNATKSSDINIHVNYVGNFAQELLRRGPVDMASLIELAYQLQNW
ncbi:elmo ced-12 family protein [Plasmopara halstedii]|uniref:Elmo ced-12 family protein n=1 Tax=Plasmopara halstedii TaxID=4781 RepID=A0A0N7L7T8_PLAHL|nr:elmo ced-12 family protein [Plasmopara halstedii]CEG47995.1 elmo ced-12 family protein [Plasmopara halstedii]|eukprot:XP_024584364.1 elmo ced-12 family protein [Plasmopara halstedii]